MPSPDQKRTAPLYHADRAPPEPPRAGDAALTFAFALATTLLIGSLVGGHLAGVAAAQLAGLAAIPLLATRARGAPIASLGLVAPSARAVLGAALLGAGIWLVDLHLVAPIARALDDDGASTRALEALVITAPIGTLVVLTIVPALAEELACRGVLVLGLRDRLGPVVAVVIGAAVFALMHLSVVRAVPMLVLGAALGTLTVRSGSVVPAMLAHAINNGISLGLATGHAPALARALDAHPLPALGAALALCAAGLGISWRRS